jgi:hypothetical protein
LTSKFDFTDGIISGLLRLGISQGEYLAYVEIADSGNGFKFSIPQYGFSVWCLTGFTPNFLEKLLVSNYSLATRHPSKG